MFFNRPTMHNYYSEAIERVKQEIKSKPDEYILGVDVGEYVEYLFEKHALLPIERDPSRDLQIEQMTKWEDVRGKFPDERTPVERVILEVTYPVVEHHLIKRVLDIFPTSQSSHLPEFVYDDQQVALVLTVYGNQPQAVESEIRSMEKWVEARNTNIAAMNPSLKQQIRHFVEERRRVIEQRANEFDDLVKQVSIPLKMKPSSADSMVDLSIRRQIKPVLHPPQAKTPENLTLDKDKVLMVIGIIDRTGRQFENAPASYNKLGEEDLRNIILSHLNTIFEGAATGETFSKRGKTDIYLRVPKGGILIAECKYWGGRQRYQDTIDQLFRYLTWRHNYGIIITFSRNVGFTNVLTEAQSAIQDHSTYERDFREVGETHFESLHHFPDDAKRFVEVHHLLYNLYVG
jgi:hypothetical protein